VAAEVGTNATDLFQRRCAAISLELLWLLFRQRALYAVEGLLYAQLPDAVAHYGRQAPLVRAQLQSPQASLREKAIKVVAKIDG
jgi:hypothetical protein